MYLLMCKNIFFTEALCDVPPRLAWLAERDVTEALEVQEGGPQVADDAGAKDQDLGGRKSSFVQCLGQDLAVWRERLLVSVGRLTNCSLGGESFPGKGKDWVFCGAVLSLNAAFIVICNFNFSL